MTDINFGRRSLGFLNHWENLDIEKFESDRAVVLCFGGNGTINAKKATRFCGTVERLCGLKNENEMSSYNHVDLIGFYYDENPEQPTIGQFSNEQRELIADKLFIKRCYDKSGNLKSDEDLIKSFAKINIATHCWGALEASYIGGIVERKLIKLGYSSKTVKEAFNQIFHLTYAPYTDHSCFPCLRISSFMDSKFRHIKDMYKEAYGSRLNGVSIRYDKPGYFRDSEFPMLKVPVLSIYSSQLVNIPENTNLRELQDEHGIETLERDYKWNQGYQSKKAKNANIVSQMASYAIADAVAISIINMLQPELVKKTELIELKSQLEDILSCCSDDDLKTDIFNNIN